jgi:hypothetical protein
VILTQKATIPLAKSGSACLKIKGINVREAQIMDAFEYAQPAFQRLFSCHKIRQDFSLKKADKSVTLSLPLIILLI